METYACKKCGMSVNATCGKCGIPLKNGHITLEDGTKVQVSKCILRLVLWFRLQE